MADWIKVRHALVRSSKVRLLAKELNLTMKGKQLLALGLAVKWLCWIDEQTENGETCLMPSELDEEIGWEGLASGLVSIGWAALGDDGRIVAVDFDKHSGDSAKKRAEAARRKGLQRARDEKAGQMSHSMSQKSVTESVTNVTKKRDQCPKKRVTRIEEKRIEENITSISSSSLIPLYAERASFAPPHDQIVAVMSAVRGCKLSDNELEDCIAKFIDVMQASGWRDQKGREIVDWAPAARLWARSWAEHNRRNTNPSRPERDCNYGKSDRY